MDKYEKLNQVKEYITRIEEDIAVSDINDKQTIMNKNITDCLKYISGIIEEIVNENNSKKRKRFFITEEQIRQLQPKKNLMVSEIANEIKRITAENNVKNFNATWITDWLLEMDILIKNDYGYRIPTQKGKTMGIIQESRINHEKNIYYINLYPENFQKYIFDNINNIIEFHYNKKRKINSILYHIRRIYRYINS